ncbi:uncharacterized protein (TIGR02594 family) [Rhodoligotrophos appendicifer]|uniref:C40 family peptidase n=1 Tax=Rhodoligotrophos appendicifer TaxID=987056 RepID=UPI001186F25B|nr:TIGR02594 family protein [Rhodoligotrophos appendicifer]
MDEIQSGEPKWLAIARSHLGTREIAGASDNSRIGNYFQKAVGKLLSEDTPWCAAFVGSCLVEAGYPSSGSLTARSYLSYGEPLASPRYGAIVILKRGREAWQGHVGFLLEQRGDRLTVLGGNQGNAVSVAQYSTRELIACRWPGQAAVPAAGQDIRAVQARLKTLGYHEVGAVDGVMGSRSRGALLAFKADRGLPLTEDIDTETLAALAAEAAPRAVAAERLAGHPEGSRIIRAARGNIATSVLVGTGSAVAAAEPYLVQIEQTAGLIGRGLAVLRNAAEVLLGCWPLVTCAGAAAIIVLSARAIAARVDDHRAGRTP